MIMLVLKSIVHALQILTTSTNICDWYLAAYVLDVQLNNVQHNTTILYLLQSHETLWTNIFQHIIDLNFIATQLAALQHQTLGHHVENLQLPDVVLEGEDDDSASKSMYSLLSTSDPSNTLKAVQEIILNLLVMFTSFSNEAVDFLMSMSINLGDRLQVLLKEGDVWLKMSAAWAIANVIGDSPKHFDLFTKHTPLIETLISICTGRPITIRAMRVYLTLLNYIHYHTPRDDIVQCIVNLLMRGMRARKYHLNDVMTFIPMLVNISSASAAKALILQEDACCVMIQDMIHHAQPNETILYGLMLINNLASPTSLLKLISQETRESLKTVAQSNFSKIRVEACQVLTHILMGQPEHVQWIIGDKTMLSLIFDHFSDLTQPSAVRHEISYTICYLALVANMAQCRLLMEQYTIMDHLMVIVADANDSELVHYALSGISTLINIGARLLELDVMMDEKTGERASENLYHAHFLELNEVHEHDIRNNLFRLNDDIIAECYEDLTNASCHVQDTPT